jgi:hypothetical protein
VKTQGLFIGSYDLPDFDSLAFFLFIVDNSIFLDVLDLVFFVLDLSFNVEQFLIQIIDQVLIEFEVLFLDLLLQ